MMILYQFGELFVLVSRYDTNTGMQVRANIAEDLIGRNANTQEGDFHGPVRAEHTVKGLNSVFNAFSWVVTSDKRNAKRGILVDRGRSRQPQKRVRYPVLYDSRAFFGNVQTIRGIVDIFPV
jgi:hypothetical protein